MCLGIFVECLHLVVLICVYLLHLSKIGGINIQHVRQYASIPIFVVLYSADRLCGAGN